MPYMTEERIGANVEQLVFDNWNDAIDWKNGGDDVKLFHMQNGVWTLVGDGSSLKLV